nr:MAG TPA: HNH endonuclease [Caudoviricetes sp.]
MIKSVIFMDYTIHKNADNRLRAYYKTDENKHKLVSYPRILMEEKLGRSLTNDEVVHHIDENPENNNIDNLVVLTKSEHCRLHRQKYFNKVVTCEVCKKKFIWTPEAQSCYYRDLNRGKNRIISCSKSCSCYYARMVQLGKA